MKKKLIWAFLGLCVTAPLLVAQTPAPAVSEPPDVSALTSALFYQLLVGEITAQEGEPGAGYALILDEIGRAHV